MTHNTPFVTTIDVELATALKAELTKQGFTFTSAPHVLIQAKKPGISCILYASGKLVVQGKKMKEFITFFLEPSFLGSTVYSYPTWQTDTTTPRIGVDEAGKGDVFGPLCIGAVFADQERITHLIRIGVRDSKSMTDKSIVKLAGQIKRVCDVDVMCILPAKYNELYYKFHNLNTLLGWGHASVIETLVRQTGCRRAVIDKFAKESIVASAIRKKNLAIDLTQRCKGEEDVVVAAASIVARAAFVREIAALSSKFGVELPKGASSVVIRAGERFVRAQGVRLLSSVAKMHFKTVRDIERQCAIENSD